MEDVKTRLDAWRAAENRRDGLASGTPEWQVADEDVRSAKKAFDAAFAQAYARYTEERFQSQSPRRGAAADRRATPAE